jgi:hypothetical protein
MSPWYTPGGTDTEHNVTSSIYQKGPATSTMSPWYTPGVTGTEHNVNGSTYQKEPATSTMSPWYTSERTGIEHNVNRSTYQKGPVTSIMSPCNMPGGTSIKLKVPTALSRGRVRICSNNITLQTHAQTYLDCWIRKKLKTLPGVTESIQSIYA